MKIVKYHAKNANGADFYFSDEIRAKKFAVKTNGKYLGKTIVPVESLPDCLK